MEVARWETRGNDYLALYKFENGGYYYRGNGCGGNLTSLDSDESAIRHMEHNAVKVLKSDRPSLKRVK